MHVDPQQFIHDIAPLLGWSYLLVAAMNLLAAVRVARRAGYVRAVVWTAVAAGFGMLGAQALAHNPLVMPEPWKNACDANIGPVSFTAGTFVALVIFYLGRRFFVIPAVAWAGLNASLLFMGLSMTDPEFAAIVTKPDNVPIVAMVYLLAIFTYTATAQAVENDRRLALGQGPVEKDYADKVLVWPDVVYIELIGIIIATVVLVVWSIVLKAPLEQPANPVVTPNPSKAPWYFLGLQEMLVFFDASIAGVTLPVLIIIGLAAIPYLDFNKQGDGYYTIKQRPFAYLVFQFGFLQLWILLILVGTLMRGPNWNFFGFYEVQDPHKVLALNNVKLSEYFWISLLGRGLPTVPVDAGGIARLGAILWREIPGIAALGAYFVLLPILLGTTVMRGFLERMGRARFTIMILLLLMMFTLPIKMVLRWTCNLSYILSIPEYFLNF